MPKTRQEIQQLKQDWSLDPSWDLQLSVGFEEDSDELLQFQTRKELEWKKKSESLENELTAKVEQLGLKGLYLILMEHERLQKRQHKAITYLVEGDAKGACKALQGIGE